MTFEEEPRRAGPIEWFTIPGRLLFIFTLVGTVAAFYGYFMGTVEDLPSGRYAVVIWIVPVTLGAFLFFIATAFVLERLGVRIYRKPRD